eukprot:Gb_07119 [translate_table: standard]
MVRGSFAGHHFNIPNTSLLPNQSPKQRNEFKPVASQRYVIITGGTSGENLTFSFPWNG